MSLPWAAHGFKIPYVARRRLRGPGPGHRHPPRPAAGSPPERTVSIRTLSPNRRPAPPRAGCAGRARTVRTWRGRAAPRPAGWRGGPPPRRAPWRGFGRGGWYWPGRPGPTAAGPGPGRGGLFRLGRSQRGPGGVADVGRSGGGLERGAATANQNCLPSQIAHCEIRTACQESRHPRCWPPSCAAPGARPRTPCR